MGCSTSTQTESQGNNRPRAKPTASNGSQMHDESETIPDQTDLEPKPDEPPVVEPEETAPPVSQEKEVHSPRPAESESQAQNHEDAPPAEGKRSEEADPDMETGDMETEEVDTGYGADDAATYDAAADDAGDTQIDAPSFGD